MISLADTWANPEERNLLEHGVRRAAGALRLGEVMPRPMVEWQNDPVGFMVEKLEIPERTIRWGENPGYASHEWDGTAEPIVTWLEAMADWKHTAVEAGTGTNKSFSLGAIYAWFVCCFEDSRVFTFAPKEDQLRLYSWMEFRRWHWPKVKAWFPLAKLTDLRLQMIPGSEQWGMWGYAVRLRAGEKEVAQEAKGQHAKYLLLVYEEMQAVDWKVVTAGRNTATGPYNIQCGVGNPSHQQDSLHRLAERAGTVPIIISAYDHPNVVEQDPDIIPGAVSQGSIDERREEYGEESPLFKAQVRGISPEQSTEAFIKKSWCDDGIARAKNPELRQALIEDGYFPALGVDVANVEGGDNAAIARGRGALCLEVEEVEILEHGAVSDASHLGVKVALEMATTPIDPMHVGIDDVGVGSSTVNKLRELRLRCQELSGSAAVQTDEDLLRESGRSYVMAGVFGNLRSQMWWQGRVDLQHGKVGLPDDPELVKDLVAVTWRLKNGKLWAQHKEEVIDDLGRSPNKGDAWIYWNWVRPRRTKPPEDEKPLRAFDPEVLEHERREGRRVRAPRPTVQVGVPLTALERIE